MATKGSLGPDMADHAKGFQVNLRDQLTLGAVSRACFMTYARQMSMPWAQSLARQLLHCLRWMRLLPRRCLFYKGGVSESQFASLMESRCQRALGQLCQLGPGLLSSIQETSSSTFWRAWRWPSTTLAAGSTVWLCLALLCRLKEAPVLLKDLAVASIFPPSSTVFLPTRLLERQQKNSPAE